MTSRIWTKKQTQGIIQDLRMTGLNVTKIDSGYEVKDKDGNIVFKAMQGHNAYLVRYDESLFSVVEI